MSVPKIAIYPGSFDPLTNGHLDVIERGRKLFDYLIIGVAENDTKSNLKSGLFTSDERIDLINQALPDKENLEVVHFSGLLMDYAKKHNAIAVIRGLRAISDFEFEFQMALMNRQLEPTIETIFLMPRQDCTYLSSRIVKEISRLGGSVDSFVPSCVSQALCARYDLS